MRASPIASAVPFSGHYRDEKRARPFVLSKLPLTHDAHDLIERVIPVAV